MIVGLHLDGGCSMGGCAIEDIMHRNGAHSENTINLCLNRCLPLCRDFVIISSFHELCASSILRQSPGLDSPIDLFITISSKSLWTLDSWPRSVPVVIAVLLTQTYIKV